MPGQKPVLKGCAANPQDPASAHDCRAPATDVPGPGLFCHFASAVQLNLFLWFRAYVTTLWAVLVD